jgi:hypothetical protein
MSVFKALGLVRRSGAADEPAGDAAEQPAELGRAVFQEAALLLDDRHHVRVVITHVRDRGVRIAYSARMDLPFRVQLMAPTLKRKCWARVVSQNEGVADLELPPDDEA